MEEATTKPTPRPLYKIAAEIRRSWKNVSPYAEPYLRAMAQLNTVKDKYGLDSAESVVLYFLANAHGWRGETARKVKEELNGMVKESVK